MKPGDTVTMRFEDLTPELQAAVLRGEKIIWAKPPEIGFASKRFVAFDPKGNVSHVPMYVSLQGGTRYRLVYDVADATLWTHPDDIKAYFKALFPEMLATYEVAEVKLSVENRRSLVAP